VPGSVRNWLRVLTPSLADCFFLALLAWLFVCGPYGWKSLLMDGDTGWHIRTGEYILAHHAVPHQDLFSYSRPNAPWFAWEWLTDVLFASLFRWAGLKAIVLFSGVLISVYATVLLRYALWRGAHPLVAAFAALLAVGASSMHFLARPHLFTLVLMPVCIWLIEADRRRPSRWIWLLIPIGALWVNLHGGFFLLLACLALLVAGTAVEERLAGHGWRRVRRYSLLLAGCAAASLCNPYGIALHAHVLTYLNSDWIRNVIQEFQAPTFRSESQLQYEGLLLMGLALTGALWRGKRVTEGLWILFLAHCSLMSARHAPIYAAVAAPVLAEQVSAWWKSGSATSKKGSISRIFYQVGEDVRPAFRRTSLWPAALVLVLAFLNAPLSWPTDFPSEGFPAALVHRNAELLESSRVLTSDQWADYLIYSFYPRQKVFIDGRSDFYGPKVGGEYRRLLEGAPDWQDILKRHAFEAALLPVNWPLASLLRLDRSWQVVQQDGQAILFRHIGLVGAPN
jgi:hypothetical protein